MRYFLEVYCCAAIRIGTCMIHSFVSIVIMTFFSVAGIVQADESIVAGNFTARVQNGAYPDYWETLEFDGVKMHTSYRHVFDGETGSVQATSRAGSSGLVRRISIDPSLYTEVSFSWKIQDIIASADITQKKGDDAPARVYITFAYNSAEVNLWEKVKFETIKLFYGEYPPIASLMYVWASHGELGTILESPYTSRVKIIVLESGAAKKGQWLSERRDIRADYRAAFGAGEIPLISGVAIMTDSDNTGDQAMAWYGDIVFSETRSANL